MLDYRRYVIFGVASACLIQSCSKEIKRKYKPPQSNMIYTVKVAEDELPSKREITAGSFTKQPDCTFLQAITNPMASYSGISGSINELLQGIYQEGLTDKLAVKLALINNPDLLAYYKNLEIGYAGLIEAGLRENPSVSLSARFPNEPGMRVNKEFEIAINYLDYFLIPLRERVAKADLQVIESEIRQQVIDLVKEVEINWLHVKILELLIDKEAELVELKEIAAGLSGLQNKAGNINDLEARNRKIHFEEAAGRLKILEVKLKAGREKLNRSLGLFESETCWNLAGEIDWKNDFSYPFLGDIEKALVENRPDIEAMRREIYAIAQKAELEQPWTYSNIKVATSTEREPDSLIVSGPAVELEVPVFNHGQAERFKYGALLQQAQKNLVAKVVQGLSQARELFNAVNQYRSLLEDLEIKILPDLAQQIKDGQALLNVMTIGVYDLFELKENEIRATIDYLHTLKKYKQARIELLHAVGGSFAHLGGR
jgi:outer membrane protein, heavy metal efflux system